MSYANRKQMSSNRTAAIVVVALIHLALGYALVTGLAYNVIKQAAVDLKTFDVTEEPPPPEEKPPPEKQPDLPPPPQVAAPPPLVRTNITSPQIQTTPTPMVQTPVYRPAPPAPPAPPRPNIQPAQAKANLASYVSNDDYPPDAISREEQGTTGFHLDVGPDGRVTNCSITSSSGSRSLDATTCRLMKSRARFTPATDNTGARVAGSASSRIRWVLPAN